MSGRADPRGRRARSLSDGVVIALASINEDGRHDHPGVRRWWQCPKGHYTDVRRRKMAAMPAAG
jgi:hypothetical protein